MAWRCGARVNDFFSQRIQMRGWGWVRVGGMRGGWGGVGWVEVDGWTEEQVQTIFPFNFFEVGGITMH